MLATVGRGLDPKQRGQGHPNVPDPRRVTFRSSQGSCFSPSPRSLRPHTSSVSLRRGTGAASPSEREALSVVSSAMGISIGTAGGFWRSGNHTGSFSTHKVPQTEEKGAERASPLAAASPRRTSSARGAAHTRQSSAHLGQAPPSKSRLLVVSSSQVLAQGGSANTPQPASHPQSYPQSYPQSAHSYQQQSAQELSKSAQQPYPKPAHHAFHNSPQPYAHPHSAHPNPAAEASQRPQPQGPRRRLQRPRTTSAGGTLGRSRRLGAGLYPNLHRRDLDSERRLFRSSVVQLDHLLKDASRSQSARWRAVASTYDVGGGDGGDTFCRTSVTESLVNNAEMAKVFHVIPQRVVSARGGAGLPGVSVALQRLNQGFCRRHFDKSQPAASLNLNQYDPPNSPGRHNPPHNPPTSPVTTGVNGGRDQRDNSYSNDDNNDINDADDCYVSNNKKNKEDEDTQEDSFVNTTPSATCAADNEDEAGMRKLTDNHNAQRAGLRSPPMTPFHQPRSTNIQSPAARVFQQGVAGGVDLTRSHSLVGGVDLTRKLSLTGGVDLTRKHSLTGGVDLTRNHFLMGGVDLTQTHSREWLEETRLKNEESVVILAEQLKAILPGGVVQDTESSSGGNLSSELMADAFLPGNVSSASPSGRSKNVSPEHIDIFPEKGQVSTVVNGILGAEKGQLSTVDGGQSTYDNRHGMIEGTLSTVGERQMRTVVDGRLNAVQGEKKLNPREQDSTVDNRLSTDDGRQSEVDGRLSTTIDGRQSMSRNSAKDNSLSVVAVEKSRISTDDCRQSEVDGKVSTTVDGRQSMANGRLSAMEPNSTDDDRLSTGIDGRQSMANGRLSSATDTSLSVVAMEKREPSAGEVTMKRLTCEVLGPYCCADCTKIRLLQRQQREQLSLYPGLTADPRTLVAPALLRRLTASLPQSLRDSSSTSSQRYPVPGCDCVIGMHPDFLFPVLVTDNDVHCRLRAQLRSSRSLTPSGGGGSETRVVSAESGSDVLPLAIESRPPQEGEGEKGEEEEGSEDGEEEVSASPPTDMKVTVRYTTPSPESQRGVFLTG